MSESIIVALLAFLGTLAGAFISNRKSSALIAYRLQALEERVGKHNCLIERTYKLEQGQELQNEKIKVINHRIDDLERGV